MTHSGYLSYDEIEALRYSILSADLSTLDPDDKRTIASLNSYLLEELTLCSSTRRIDFQDEELALLDEVIDENYSIESVSDIKQITEETQSSS